MNTVKAAVFSFGLVSAIASSGCNKESLSEMTQLTDRMCACKDKACVASAKEDMLNLLKSNAAEANQPSEAESKKAGELMEQALACAKSVEAGSTPVEP